MHIYETDIKGLYCLENTPIEDHRGYFARIFCQKELDEYGLSISVAQMNMSLTVTKGAIRGMHFQHPPYGEIKIVRCVEGACFDVAVDIRKDSPTFLQYHAEVLTPENGKALYIPKGFAHGFQSLEENTRLLYTHSEFYTPSAESALNYADPKLNIQWALPVTDISERDTNHPLLTEDFMGLEI